MQIASSHVSTKLSLIDLANASSLRHRKIKKNRLYILDRVTNALVTGKKDRRGKQRETRRERHVGVEHSMHTHSVHMYACIHRPVAHRYSYTHTNSHTHTHSYKF